MQPESRLAIRWDAILDGIPKSHWYNIQQVAIRGTPDRLGVVNGRFVALEFKTGVNAKRSKLQEYELEKIRDAGGYANFVYPENWCEVYRKLMIISRGDKC